MVWNSVALVADISIGMAAISVGHGATERQPEMNSSRAIQEGRLPISDACPGPALLPWCWSSSWSPLVGKLNRVSGGPFVRRGYAGMCVNDARQCAGGLGRWLRAEGVSGRLFAGS